MEINNIIKYDSFSEFIKKESDLLLAIQEDCDYTISSIDDLIYELTNCGYVEEINGCWINHYHRFICDNKELSTIKRYYIKDGSIGDPMLDDYVLVKCLTSDRDKWSELFGSTQSLDELHNILINNYKFPEKLWK